MATAGVARAATKAYGVPGLSDDRLDVPCVAITLSPVLPFMASFAGTVRGVAQGPRPSPIEAPTIWLDAAPLQVVRTKDSSN